MEFLIRVGYLVVSLTVGIYVYYWSSTFKKLGSSTMDELNEGDEEEDDMVDESEMKGINYFGTGVFIIIGVIVWTLLGVTIGRIALEITENKLLKWLVYFFMYFFFLRFPFGVANKMVKRSYGFKVFPEKIIFAIVMIASYILSICCYEKLPEALKWHLKFLNKF